MSQIKLTLSRNQAAVMHDMLIAGVCSLHRSGDLSGPRAKHAQRVMERIERRFAIHRFDPAGGGAGEGSDE